MIHADRSTHKLTLDGGWSCWFLENPDTLIPAGRYEVLLTPSARAAAGTLWTPWPDKQLPLVVVPDRSGIRIHAANHADQLEGCIAVGLERFEDGSLGTSRTALVKLRMFTHFPEQLEIG